MTVNPGFGGQAFIHEIIGKVARVRAMTDGRDIDIEVDGGITPETAGAVAAAGANVLVSGAAVFKGGPRILRRQYRRHPSGRRRGPRRARMRRGSR